MRSRTGIAAILLIVAVLVAGCSKGEVENIQVAGTIRAMSSNYFLFMQNSGGDEFIAEYPDVGFEVIPPGNVDFGGLMTYVEQSYPDLLVLLYPQYRLLAEEGKLYALDALIARDGVDLDGMHEGVVGLLREPGDGQLFGLTPDFRGSALVYNRDLFDRHGVPYPSDGMTWDEFIELANRFPSDGGPEDRIYGFETGNSFGMFIENLGIRYYGLTLFDLDNRLATIDTPLWRQVWEQALRAYRTNAFHFPLMRGYADLIDKHTFFQGRAAMALIPYDEITGDLMGLAYGGDKADFAWGAAAPIVHEQDPEISPSLELNWVYAINRNAANVEITWEFLKFIAGEKYAQLKPQFRHNRLSIYKDRSPSLEGIDAELFYRPEKHGALPPHWGHELPASFMLDYRVLLSGTTEAITDGQFTLEEALASLQADVQEAYERLEPSAESSE